MRRLGAYDSRWAGLSACRYARPYFFGFLAHDDMICLAFRLEGRNQMTKIGGILLCAGYGSRLAPLTDVIPKPAIPFCGVPMAHYALHSLEEAGIDELGMNVHHLPDEMIKAMHDGQWMHETREIVISRENDEILGTGGGAARVARLMPTCDRYIIYHGDVLCAADLRKALAQHEASGSDVTLVVLPRPLQIQENVRQSLGMIGVVEHEIVCIRDWWKNNQALDGFEPRCFSGIHIVERRVLDAIEPGKNVCLVTQVYREMLARGARIHAYEPDEEVFFADVGTPATYLDAQKRCLMDRQKNDAGIKKLASLSMGKKVNDTAWVFGNIDTSRVGQIGENVCIHAGVSCFENDALDNEMRCREGGIKLSGAWICGH